MRNKLQKFTAFADTLLPHETEYLLSVQRFDDDERLAILRLIDYNCRNIYQFTPYGEEIDKRKYSHLKNWITEQLRSIDVDVHFEWIMETERRIMTDVILPEEEKGLLKSIRNYRHPIFFFTQFYELAQNYRHFLLIRLRYADHALVDAFLNNYRTDYLRSKEINDKINLATIDIVEQYQSNLKESIQWEEWLKEVYYDEQLDGLNRYLALVRLTFIGLNYRKLDSLVSKFEYQDELFKKGAYYSKRILLNYYSNRLLLHSKFKEFDKAAYYGRLSVRVKNHDYLFYVTNLCAVLLRQGKAVEALAVMKSASAEARTTQNLHSKVGYVAFYIECMNQNGRFRNAENYAHSFLQAYKKEIFEYRWHIFFSAYLEAILQQHKFHKILQLVHQHRLLDKEKQYQANANYLPTILWYYAAAEYLEGLIKEKELSQILLEFIEKLDGASGKTRHVVDLLKQLKPHIPVSVDKTQDRMVEKGLLVFKF
ncbi:MAG: hypothetical protein H6562_14310 [Lewinellaceae bacterium]|nr:hypothetical protein [Lewinellaceae bacterium]